MSFTDYLINGALVALVILQIRGRRLSAFAFFTPIVLVSIAAVAYLSGVPTAGNDLVLALLGAGIGLALGVGAGLTTRVFRRSDGAVVAKAGGVAAVLWILGVGSRIAFEVYATNGGAASIARLSAHHNITSVQAWVAGLILMALVEVFARTAILGGKYLRLGGNTGGSGTLVRGSHLGDLIGRLTANATSSNRVTATYATRRPGYLGPAPESAALVGSSVNSSSGSGSGAWASAPSWGPSAAPSAPSGPAPSTAATLAPSTPAGLIPNVRAGWAPIRTVRPRPGIIARAIMEDSGR